MLRVDFCPDIDGGRWNIYYPTDGVIFRLGLWMGDYYFEKDEAAKIPHVELGKVEDDMLMVFAIEFRHGHSYDILWWIEHEIREAIGRELKGWMFDDGVGEIGEPDKRTYSSYYDYQMNAWNISLKRDIIRKSVMILMMLAERRMAPKEVRRLYGL